MKTTVSEAQPVAKNHGASVTGPHGTSGAPGPAAEPHPAPEVPLDLDERLPV